MNLKIGFYDSITTLFTLLPQNVVIIVMALLCPIPYLFNLYIGCKNIRRFFTNPPEKTTNRMRFLNSLPKAMLHPPIPLPTSQHLLFTAGNDKTNLKLHCSIDFASAEHSRLKIPDD